MAETKLKPSQDDMKVAGAADRCTLCHRLFRHLDTFSMGYKRGDERLHTVGECCAGRLTEIWGLGLTYAPPPEPDYKRDDRRWFARNTTRTHRIRRALADDGLGTEWVVIRQVAPGQRHRMGFDVDLFDFANADDAVAHLIFDTLFAARAAGRDGVTADEIRQRIAAVHQSGTAAQ
jgi:hypothetical protein